MGGKPRESDVGGLVNVGEGGRGWSLLLNSGWILDFCLRVCMVCGEIQNNFSPCRRSVLKLKQLYRGMLVLMYFEG